MLTEMQTIIAVLVLTIANCIVWGLPIRNLYRVYRNNRIEA